MVCNSLQETYEEHIPLVPLESPTSSPRANIVMDTEEGEVQPLDGESDNVGNKRIASEASSSTASAPKKRRNANARASVVRKENNNNNNNNDSTAPPMPRSKGPTPKAAPTPQLREKGQDALSTTSAVRGKGHAQALQYDDSSLLTRTREEVDEQRKSNNTGNYETSSDDESDREERDEDMQVARTKNVNLYTNLFVRRVNVPPAYTPSGPISTSYVRFEALPFSSNIEEIGTGPHEEVYRVATEYADFACIVKRRKDVPFNRGPFVLCHHTPPFRPRFKGEEHGVHTSIRTDKHHIYKEVALAFTHSGTRIENFHVRADDNGLSLVPPY